MNTFPIPKDVPANSVRVLLIGDIVGRVGRKIVTSRLREFRQEHRVDFCVANGENMAGGSGITVKAARDILGAGVDVITSGDHVWRKKEIIPLIESDNHLLRPANVSPMARGNGSGVYDLPTGHKIAVVNLLGRAFMPVPSDCPYRAASEIVARVRRQTPIVVVDFHAEATSEKTAMGWHLDGKVSAVVGTHTHVQTADERVLPKGTAYLTDLGMTGPHDSVIGRRTDRVLSFLVTQMPAVFDVANGNVQLSGALVTIDGPTGLAVDITRVRLHEAPDPGGAS